MHPEENHTPEILGSKEKVPYPAHSFTYEEICAKALQISHKQPENSDEANWFAAIEALKIERQYEYKRGEELFSLYRDYLKHEDNLINQRTTWLITLQSFLIATFGFTYQNKYIFINTLYSSYLSKADDLKSLSVHPGTRTVKILENIYKQYPEIGTTVKSYDQFFYLLSFIGIITSVIALLSVTAAVCATSSLITEWYSVSFFPQKKPRHKKGKSIYEKILIANHLPDITGGGSGYAHVFGKGLSIALPLFFLGFWLFVFWRVSIKML